MKIDRKSFGEDYNLTVVDKVGIWLSTRRIVKLIKKNKVKRMADIGCGFDARLSRQTRHLVEQSIAVDVALNDDLIGSNDFGTYVGYLPDVLDEIPVGSLDLIVLNAVIEHLDNPVETLQRVRHLLSDDGTLFVNVPSWFGKRPLEVFAFKLNLSPADEMEDHRRYYNKRELWLEIRAAGFQPSKLKVRRHKLGCAIFAIARH